VLYANVDKDGKGKDQYLEFRPCHEKCREEEWEKIDFDKVAGPYSGEDVAKVRLVRIEW